MDGISARDADSVLARLASHIASFDPDRITPQALATCKAGIVDTVGVALGGMPEPCTQILMATPGIADASGPSLVFGTDRRTSALDATLINGTASHALDYDDFSSILGGHQSVPLVAPLFALAEERGLSGRQIVDAYVVGLEVEHRFARAVHPHHYDKGWHPTATLGIFGTVAAAAFALKLNPETIATAMAIAASMASGIKANFGTMTKPLHIGHSVRSGLMAVFLAERGFEANPGAMEHDQGFLNVFNGPGLYDPTPLTDSWSGPLDIELPSLGLKQFPCCGSTHQAIFAMIGLARDADIDPNDVRKIEIGTHPRRLRHTDTPSPQSALQAKFSVQYVVARALLDRSVRLNDFRQGAYAQPEIRRLLDMTTAAPLNDDGPGLTGPWDAEVAITLADGRRLVGQVEGMVGRSGDHAMSVDDLREKFIDCATLAVTGDRAARVFDALTDLENQTDMAKIIALLAGGGK